MPVHLRVSMEHNVSNTNSSISMKAAFEAAGIGVTDPNAEISFKDGCAIMGFYRQNFLIALKRQRDMDALGNIIAPVRLPETHWKDGSRWFYLREVEAYQASTHRE